MVQEATECFILPSWHVDTWLETKESEKMKKKKKMDPLNQVVTQSPAADTGRDTCITHSLNSLALTNICRVIAGSINVMTKGVPPCFSPGHRNFSFSPMNWSDSIAEYECVRVCVCTYLHSPLDAGLTVCFILKMKC